MKLIVFLLFVSTSALASISTDEKREALSTTREVMTRVMMNDGGDVRLMYSRVADEFGTRLTVEFTIVRDMSETRKCSYSYDRVLKRVIPDSWNCDL